MKQKIWTLAFLVIIVCVCTGILNAVYVYTAPRVEQNRLAKIQRSVLEVFGIPFSESDVSQTFSRNITVDSESVSGMDVYRFGDKVAFEVKGSGLWGPITILLAVEPDLKTIICLRVLENQETPGLGAQIGKPEFEAQFKGKELRPRLRIVSHRKAKGPNEVDAITGATRTSEALEKLINSGVEIFYKKYRHLGTMKRARQQND